METELSTDLDTTTKGNGAQPHSISCTECQRRKQKCSRQWPCNHCQSRKVLHMCHFTPKKASFSNDLVTTAAGKRKEPKQNRFPMIGPLVELHDDESTAADALKALGYLQSDGSPLFFGMLFERHNVIDSSKKTRFPSRKYRHGYTAIQ